MSKKEEEEETSASGAVSKFNVRMRELEGADFVRFLLPDMHGVLRGKMFPSRSVNASGEAIAQCILTFQVNGPPVDIDELNATGVGNWIVRPVRGPYLLPSSKKRPHGSRIAFSLGELFTASGDPVDVDVRRTARRQLERLAKHNLTIFGGSEFEMRMFKAQEGEKRVTAHATKHMFTVENIEPYEHFLVELDRRLQDFGIEMYTMHTECGRGQLEIPLRPAWGVDIADNSAIFKMILKDTARDHDMDVSFMTKDMFTEFANGSHFNHSLWYQPTAGSTGNAVPTPKSNAFHNPSNPDQLSNLGRHWLAGLLHHSVALTALCCPTVNCYRRLHTPWSPGAIEWGFDNRFAAFRVKVGEPQDTYIENRIPSGAANPYLVLAATVAAGLDGVERGLEPPTEMQSVGKLPRFLAETLSALENNEVMKKALGERFISWFLTLKRAEIQLLDGVDVLQQKEDDLEREKELYQFFF